MMSRSSGRSSFHLLALALIAFGAEGSAHAAACCAGSGAAPSILSGDDSAQVSASLARGTVIGDAPVHGIPVFRNDSSSEITETLLVSGAILLSDRFQVGTSVPFIRHSVSGSSGNGTRSTGFGDIRFNTAYEFLPEWTYSAWKPRGFVFLQLTLPTGTSIYDSQSAGAVDALGRGFYGVGAGTLLIKRWTVWDAVFIPEAHYSFARTFRPDPGGSLRVGLGWGGSLALGFGASPGSGDFRFGLRVQPLYESARKTSVEGATSRTNEQLSWNTTLEASYLVSATWTAQASYTDQTLLGPAINTTLSRTIALGLQHRWER